MRKLFDEELSLAELKNVMKRFTKKQENCWLWMAIIIGLIAVAVIVVAVCKMRSRCDGYCCDDFDDFEDDFEDDELEKIDGVCSDKDFED